MSLKDQEETVYVHVQQGMASPCPLKFWKQTVSFQMDSSKNSPSVCFDSTPKNTNMFP